MKDLLKKINEKKTKQAFYHLFDFHVHSIASKDVIHEKRDSLSEEEQVLIKDISVTSNTSAKDVEELVLGVQNIIEDYYQILANHTKSITENNEWCILSITDHNVFNFSSKLSKLSMHSDKLKENRLIILPGVELEVEFPFNEHSLSCHILLIFKPETDYNDILLAINDYKSWNYGEKIIVDSITDFISKMRHHSKSPCIAISAHINSTKGIRGEANKMLTKLEASIAKLSTNEEENKEELEIVKSKLPDKESFEFEILNLIGKCGFDALQVAKLEDNFYFSKINKIDRNLGRSNPVLFSDAHRIKDVLNIDNSVYPYLKLNDISSIITSEQIFADILSSVRRGESRITYSPIEKSTYWIEGIRIMTNSTYPNDFWPYESEAQECIIPLSRNLNCLIGGRGSGKSAIIEALCFMYDKSDEYNKGGNKEKDWYSRAIKVLGNCTMDTISRYLNAENTNKKKAFVHKRSFYLDSSHSKSEVYNIDNETINLNSFEKLPRVEYYRFNEIEEYTKPEKLRRLFDDICGKEIDNINSQIQVIESSFSENKRLIIELAKELKELFHEDSPLRYYVLNFIKYEEANKPDIKAKFEKLDNIEDVEDKISSLRDEFSKLELSGLETFKNFYTSFLKQLETDSIENSDCGFVLDELKKQLPNKNSTIEDEINNSINIVEELTVIIDDKIVRLNHEIEGRLEIAEKELRDNNINPEEDYRQNCKENFEESESSFKEYLRVSKLLSEKIEERKELYNKLKNLSLDRSSIRELTANDITQSLEKHLDNRIIQIEARANIQSDKKLLRKWLEDNLFVSGTQQKTKRVSKLLNLSIDNCIESFYSVKNFNNALFENDIHLVSDGRINNEDSNAIKSNNIVFSEFNFSELESIKDEKELLEKLPKEIKDGLLEINIENLSKYLDLYTLSNNDEPVILLNDRPSDTEIKRDIKNLSPGQRCSAILPIILTNGEGPLIIDQPEDNLDNKLVREVIVNILSRIKLKRQVIIATHNPNLPVLGDSENIIALQAKGEGQCDFISLGSIDDKKTITSITEIMEGGREAFQYRSSLYEEHWKEGAER